MTIGGDHERGYWNMRTDAAGRSFGASAGSTILFRSAVSGLWYETPDAAGDVDCIALHGRLYQWSRGHAELYRLCVERCPEFGKLTFDAQTKVRDAVLRDLSN